MEAVIGIGSNLGNRLSTIRGAIESINESRNTRVRDFSSVYESEAHIRPGQEQQGSYLNAVVVVETCLSADALLDACLKIEVKYGRQRVVNRTWQPRTLDLDILAYGDSTIRLPSLIVPHPRLHQRRFVLEPLNEIRPDLHIPPPFDADVQYLLASCKDAASLVLSIHKSNLFPPEYFAR